jgi:ribosomal protein S12 methylthiotransferase
MSLLPIVDPTVQEVPQASQPGEKGRYSFISLGCPKNLVDSERMLGRLQLDGYELVSDVDQADFVVVNTCGFIERARNESYATIREMAERKRSGTLKGLIVAGCLAEREREQVQVQVPEIDALVGVFARDEVGRVADRILGHLAEQRQLFRPAPSRPLSDMSRLRVTPRHLAYLKISEGCNRRCTFCAIPKMRGRHATKPIEEVLAETQELVADGVRELNIVAQDTTYYGLDLYGKPRLADLLKQMDQVEGLDWIRLLYLYPMYLTDELVEVLAGSQRIVPYLDMPLQHANDEMLRRMQRRVNRTRTEQLLERLRSAIPNLVMRTTFIVGFPGETDEQFEDLYNFVAEQRFERLGVFTYSVEPGTPAADLPDQVPEDVKLDRQERLMMLQQEIAFAWNARQVGKTMDVLLDQPVPDEPTVWAGRTYADAPDIDGLVYVNGEGLEAGQIVPCEIVQSEGYDLVAVAVGEPR